MNRVYLLGAGASRDLKFVFTKLDGGYNTINISPFNKKGPLNLGFFYDTKIILNCVKEYYKTINWPVCLDGIDLDIKFFRNIFGAKLQLIKSIEDFYQIKIEQIFEDKTISDKISIEELYMNIEKSDNKDKKLLLRELLEYYYTSLSFISYYCHSIQHRVLAEDLLYHGGDAISFNWDIFLEEALYKTEKWDFCDGYFVGFERILQKGQYEKDKLEKKYTTKNFILKPHGSINWFSTNNSKLVLINQMPLEHRSCGALLLNYRENFDKGKPPCESAIVPPGFNRIAFPEVWENINKTLSKADEIIIIGFKIKNTDGHIEQKLRDIEYKKDLKVKVIDPNADKLIEEKYKGIFKGREIINLCPTFTEYCKSIDKNNYLTAFEELLKTKI